MDPRSKEYAAQIMKGLQQVNDAPQRMSLHQLAEANLQTTHRIIETVHSMQMRLVGDLQADRANSAPSPSPTPKEPTTESILLNTMYLLDALESKVKEMAHRLV